MKSIYLKFAGSAILMTALSTPAFAQDYYVSASVGILDQSSSSNSGETGAFTTGNLGDGSTLDVAAGTPYGWETEFDSGFLGAAEFGRRFDSGLRVGVELSYGSSDVDTHTDVTLGGGAIGALDAAAIAGSPTALGVTIADVVADGRGDLDTFNIFLNGYFDFDTGGPLTPYVGAGIGYSQIDVQYTPSGIAVIDDNGDAFGYQFKAGASFQFDSPIEVFGEFTYRASEDVELQNSLFPGTLDIENEQMIFAAGVRYNF